MRNTGCYAVGVRTVAHAIGCCALGLVLSSILTVKVSAQQAAQSDAAAHVPNEAEYASIAAPAIAQPARTMSAPANRRLQQAPLRALLLGTLGADVLTSLISLNGGAHEANPLVLSTHPAPFIAQAVAWGAAEMWILNRVSKRHPRLAKTLAYVQIGGSLGASIQNSLVIRRQRMR
jgi:hypothetical protein